MTKKRGHSGRIECGACGSARRAENLVLGKGSPWNLANPESTDCGTFFPFHPPGACWHGPIDEEGFILSFLHFTSDCFHDRGMEILEH